MSAHAGGHRASACMPHAGAIMATHAGGHALGHLGHLGHGFKLQAGASMRMSLGHLGHLFFVDPNDPKGADLEPREFPGFGSFGSFCHAPKIGAGRVVNMALHCLYIQCYL